MRMAEHNLKYRRFRAGKEKTPRQGRLVNQLITILPQEGDRRKWKNDRTSSYATEKQAYISTALLNTAVSYGWLGGFLILNISQSGLITMAMHLNQANTNQLKLK